MTSKQIPNRALATSSSSVRRNLFHHHLSRRPTGTSSSAVAKDTHEAEKDASNDVVAKDGNGNYQILVPKLPPLEDDDGALEEEMGNERGLLENKMLELYKDRSLHTGDPNELMSAVHENLKRQVASLEEDNWIFEAEPPSRDI